MRRLTFERVAVDTADGCIPDVYVFAADTQNGALVVARDYTGKMSIAFVAGGLFEQPVAELPPAESHAGGLEKWDTAAGVAGRLVDAVDAALSKPAKRRRRPAKAAKATKAAKPK